MDNTTNDKSCTNCGYFFQHYGWTAKKFRKIECGHCLKHRLTKSDYRGFPSFHRCEDWQPKEKEIAIRKESIERTLTEMAIEINEILTLLESGYLKP